ncbi:hypothetical protein ID866_5912 [Astraeus odoratus]|nr:hypothetical protein ID866_5912 [Astraeus odoratus]
MGTTVGKPLYGHTASILSVAFAPQGEYIVSGSHDHTVRLWDVETYFQGSTEETFQVSNAIQRHTDGVESVTFSLDGRIQVWDIEVAALEQMSLEGHSAAVKSIAVSLDGKHVASGSIDGTVQVWNLQTGTPVGEPLRGHLDSVNSVAFSPDGKFIVSGSTDASIRLWNVESKNQINGPFQGHIHGVIKYIASGTYNGTVQLWDAKSVSQIGLPMDGHRDAILSIAFSPNGKYIVSGSNDKTVRVWEIETSAQVGSPLLGHTDSVRSVAFSPDGKCILSGSFDQTIRIWCKDNNPEPTIKFSSVASHALKDAHRLFADMPNSTGYLNDLVTLSENGWIIGPNDQLLLWVPPTYSSLLYSTWNTLVLPRSGPELDLSEMAHGSAWELCYIGHNS